jgi:streptomycin 6-kinase
MVIKEPSIITDIAARWNLSELIPAFNLGPNYIFSGLQGTNPIIMKLGSDITALKKETAALNAFSEFGVIKVISEEDGIILLERAMPGISLKNYFPSRDDKAIEIACDITKRLHRAKITNAHNFPHIKEWLTILDIDQEIPLYYLEKAKDLRDKLLQTSHEDVLLHGDLHHDNILQHGSSWLAIDPKGVIGEPAYEAAAFIRNPIVELLGNDNIHNIICNRIFNFARILELPAQRLLDWCFVQAVLSWSFALEDDWPSENFKQLSDIFDKIISAETEY